MISLILFDRVRLLNQMLEQRTPPSPARTILLNLIQTTNQELIEATTNAWLHKHYGVRPYQTQLQIPNCLIPHIDDPDEFFQFITDCLKRSIES